MRQVKKHIVYVDCLASFMPFLHTISQPCSFGTFYFQSSVQTNAPVDSIFTETVGKEQKVRPRIPPGTKPLRRVTQKNSA